MNWLSHPIITSSIAALTVALILAVVNHRLNGRRDGQTERRKAAEEFRDAVLNALTGMYPLPTDWPDDVTQCLKSAFGTLEIAVARFRPFVPSERKDAFDRAWFEYRCGTGRNIDLQNYHHYIAFDSNPNAKDNFHHNVDTLLSFAEAR